MYVMSQKFLKSSGLMISVLLTCSLEGRVVRVWCLKVKGSSIVGGFHQQFGGGGVVSCVKTLCHDVIGHRHVT